MFQTEGPPGSELNALGVYLLISLVFVVLAMVEFALVLLWSRASSSLTIKNRFKKMLFIRKGKPISEMMGRKDEALEKTSFHTVDLVSFFAHLLFYFIFNVIYWTHYLQD